jgi:hypothetical protein
MLTSAVVAADPSHQSGSLPSQIALMVPFLPVVIRTTTWTEWRCLISRADRPRCCLALAARAPTAVSAFAPLAPADSVALRRLEMAKADGE